jgi:hypothetical protein
LEEEELPPAPFVAEPFTAFVDTPFPLVEDAKKPPPEPTENDDCGKLQEESNEKK